MYIWGHERRFNSYTQYFKKQFGQRVQKVSIDAGFTCPNRDGSVAYGGCAYCNNDTFNPKYCDPQKTISWQIEQGMKFSSVRYKKPEQYLAYFQAYSNTYAPLSELKKIYEQALTNKAVVGLVIGTRPDCIDDEKLDYFAELSKNHYIIIEYGVESCYDKTLEYINRGHNFETSQQAILKTTQRGIKTGIHMLFGLPGETKEEMLHEAAIISNLPINTIKFHQLQITKHTRFAKEYNENPRKFKLFEKDEYIDFIVTFIEQLNPNIIIERFASESHRDYLIAPHWGEFKYFEIVEEIEKALAAKDTWQGKYYNTKK